MHVLPAASRIPAMPMPMPLHPRSPALSAPEPAPDSRTPAQVRRDETLARLRSDIAGAAASNAGRVAAQLFGTALRELEPDDVGAITREFATQLGGPAMSKAGQDALLDALGTACAQVGRERSVGAAAITALGEVLTGATPTAASDFLVDLSQRIFDRFARPHGATPGREARTWDDQFQRALQCLSHALGSSLLAQQTLIAPALKYCAGLRPTRRPEVGARVLEAYAPFLQAARSQAEHRAAAFAQLVNTLLGTAVATKAATVLAFLRAMGIQPGDGGDIRAFMECVIARCTHTHCGPFIHPLLEFVSVRTVGPAVPGPVGGVVRGAFLAGMQALVGIAEPLDFPVLQQLFRSWGRHWVATGILSEHEAMRQAGQLLLAATRGWDPLRRICAVAAFLGGCADVNDETAVCQTLKALVRETQRQAAPGSADARDLRLLLEGVFEQPRAVCERRTDLSVATRVRLIQVHWFIAPPETGAELLQEVEAIASLKVPDEMKFELFHTVLADLAHLLEEKACRTIREFLLGYLVRVLDERLAPGQEAPDADTQALLHKTVSALLPVYGCLMQEAVQDAADPQPQLAASGQRRLEHLNEERSALRMEAGRPALRLSLAPLLRVLSPLAGE